MIFYHGLTNHTIHWNCSVAHWGQMEVAFIQWGWGRGRIVIFILILNRNNWRGRGDSASVIFSSAMKAMMLKPNISFLRIEWPLFVKTFTQGCFVPSLFEIGLCSRGEDLNNFSLFGYKLPFKKAVTLQLNKLKIPFTKGLCQVWLKLTHWFWRKRILNFCYILLSPLEKGCGLNFNKLESSLPSMLCAK